MIEEFDIETYLYISPNEFWIYLFDKKNLKNLYKKGIKFNNNYFIDVNNLDKFIEDNIFKIEKLAGHFVKNIVLVVENDSPIRKIEDLQGKTVATELVNYTERYLAKHSIAANVEYSWGATEAKVVEGLADAAVEITETGSTIRAHGLRIVCDILHTHTAFIANKKSFSDKWKKTKIEQISLMLQSALAARHRVLLKMNVPSSSLKDVTNQLPSLHAPTVNKLTDESWVAIETVVDRDQVRTLIPKLKIAGAQGILEIDLKHVS